MPTLKKVKREDINTLTELDRIHFELTEPDLSSLVQKMNTYKTMDDSKMATINGFMVMKLKNIVDLVLKIS